MKKWDHEDLIFFELAACSASWLLLLLGLISHVNLHVPFTGFSLAANTIFLLAASIMPGACLLIVSLQCRALIFRFRAPFYVYSLALIIGFGLPFSGYLGFGDRYPLFGPETRATLIRVFLINIFLAPFWEELLWRGYFYSKIREIMPEYRAILVGALAWTIWHLGFMFFLYKNGFTVEVLCFLPIQYFAAGITLSCIFILGHETLYPCIALHAGFNAAVNGYYGIHNRMLSIPAYAAETTTMLAVALSLFFIVKRRTSLITQRHENLPLSET
jgi:membrane protease YdiL (CAAX protease family)